MGFVRNVGELHDVIFQETEPFRYYNYFMTLHISVFRDYIKRLNSKRNCLYNRCRFRYNSKLFFTIALPAHSGPRPLIQFRNHFSQTVGFRGRGISPSQGRYLSTGQHKHGINAYRHQTSMPWVGIELVNPASERAEIVHALDCAATVTGSYKLYSYKLKMTRIIYA
jgi:hypothetical protein